jgi:hypothetical protein
MTLLLLVLLFLLFVVVVVVEDSSILIGKDVLLFRMALSLTVRVVDS